MKVNVLDAHDRYIHFIHDQWSVVTEGVEECLKKNSLSLAIQHHCPYVYIFGHFRTHEDGVTRRLVWQPRIVRPEPQPNSFLFRAKSNSEELEICWVLPDEKMWNQYKKGNITEDSDIIQWSIGMYQHKIQELRNPMKEDLSDEKAKQVMLSIARDFEQQAQLAKLAQPVNEK